MIQLEWDVAVMERALRVRDRWLAALEQRLARAERTAQLVTWLEGRVETVAAELQALRKKAAVWE